MKAYLNSSVETWSTLQSQEVHQVKSMTEASAPSQHA